MDLEVGTYILPAVIAGAVALAVAVISGLIIVWQTRKTIKSEYETWKKGLAVQYVTDKRVDWIQNLRDTTGEYLAEVHRQLSLRVPSVSCRMQERALHLELLLNFDGDIDRYIIDLIRMIHNGLGKEDRKVIKKYNHLLMVHVEVYLKLEWNRVRLEVENGEYSDAVRMEQTLELYDRIIRHEAERKGEPYSPECVRAELEKQYFPNGNIK